MKELRLKDIKRPELIMIALAVLLALAWVLLNQQVGSARDDFNTANRKLATIKGDYNRLNSGEEKAALEKELKELQDSQSAVEFPPRSDALNFGAELASYVSNNRLDLMSLGSKDATIKLGSAQRSAVVYSFVATGTSDALIGVLSLLDKFSTASVQRLSLITDNGGVSWELDLGVAVVY